MFESGCSVLRPVTAFVKVVINHRILRDASNLLMIWAVPDFCN
jgi:hypothetical protein